MYAIWLSVIIPLLVMIFPLALERMQTAIIDNPTHTPTGPKPAHASITTP